MHAPTLLLALSGLLKLLTLILLSELDAAFDARHGKGPAAALAGWAKAPVAMASWASRLATLTLGVGMVTVVARDDADPTWCAQRVEARIEASIEARIEASMGVDLE
jgi:hypothetical protein